MCTLSAKEIGYHFIDSVTESWRYFRFVVSPAPLINRAAMGRGGS